ncbi:M48 family metallopeptidase [Chitinibacter tainanensis]|uniref:M48 family metallopeptidase n=1 Tax=Chitinibacter tainanensis TaxID=230667 RepID=UPI00040B7DEE|nr:M48 family metallopeptidase [Chitinibacter tainanensis]
MLSASYLDGHTSHLFTVQLSRVDEQLLIHGEGWERQVPLAACALEPILGNLPARVNLPDGAVLECPAAQALAELLGQGQQPLAQLEARWRYSVLAVLGIVLAAVLLYWQGMPLAAHLAAKLTPVKLESMLGEATLASLPKLGITLQPSQLPPARQQALLQRWQAQTQASHFPYQLHFYDLPNVGANAFALPGGQVVVTDQLATLLSDDEIIAVLLHEMGHVERQHGLRNVYQAAGLGLIAAVVLGDAPSAVSNVAAMAALVVQLGYTRQFEREADEFAAQRLRAQGKSPAVLADALEKLVGSQPAHTEVPELLATHPATAERLRTLRQP